MPWLASGSSSRPPPALEMQPRRRREASTQSEWPQLSLLAVYSETPVLAEADKGVRLDDAALEAAKVLCLVSPGGEEVLEGARRGRVMGTVMGVAAFARCVPPPSSCRFSSASADEWGSAPLCPQHSRARGPGGGQGSALEQEEDALVRGRARLLRPRRALLVPLLLRRLSGSREPQLTLHPPRLSPCPAHLDTLDAPRLRQPAARPAPRPLPFPSTTTSSSPTFDTLTASTACGMAPSPQRSRWMGGSGSWSSWTSTGRTGPSGGT